MTEQEPDHTIFERRDPLIGATLDGRFRIDARLAAGGFGAIYRATDLRSKQEVALKVLHAGLTADPLIVARFRREGATLTSLRDPHTVIAHELGESPDGTLYIVMELLRGETLHEAFRKNGGPLPWRRVTAIARAVCSSLAEAHARGIVHRDLKPANIHLQERDGKRDFVKVLDFGIAKILRSSNNLEASELTQAGQMIGTFDYMAPEQMLGGVVGARCDIYTLGVVMYEMISGRQPFAEATSPTHLIGMLLTSTPPPMSSRVPVPPALDHIVMRCLAREQQDRYRDVLELAAALDRVLADGPREQATLLGIGESIGPEEPTRIAPARMTPTSAAQLRAALEPTLPVEPLEVRAQGSQPVIAPALLRDDGRGSQPPMRNDGRGSQPPMPAADARETATVHAKPNAGKSRGSQPQVDVRASQPAVTPQPQPQVDPRASQPAMAPYPQVDPRTPQPAVVPYPQVDPRTPQPAMVPYPQVDPRTPQPAMVPYPQVDPRASQPAMAPYPQPQPYPPQPMAYPHGGYPAEAAPPAYPVAMDPRAPYAIADGRGSQPYIDPRGGWQPLARRRPDAGFDAARDAAVGRMVWVLVVVLGIVLAMVVAKML